MADEKSKEPEEFEKAKKILHSMTPLGVDIINQFYSLNKLYKIDYPLSRKNICKRLDCDNKSVASCLNLLENLGYVLKAGFIKKFYYLSKKGKEDFELLIKYGFIQEYKSYRKKFMEEFK
jgi:hypothetical protein